MVNSTEVPEELDYVYYANNFSIYDVPPGVIPKYFYIVLPGVAYLLNGLPERTNHNDPYNVWVILMQFVIGVIGTSVDSFSIWTVIKNKALSRSVRLFLLSDGGIRLYNSLLTFYHIECMISWSCVNPNGYPFSWVFLNQILSTLMAAFDPVKELLALGLSVNRIFAVYFNGLYYDKAQKAAIPYILLSFGTLAVLYLNFLGNNYGSISHVLRYTGALFSPLMYMTIITSRTDFNESVDALIPWMGYGWVGMALVFDLSTLSKVRKMKKASSNSKSRADFKLAAMTTCSVLVMIVQLLSFQMSTLFLTSSEPLILCLFNIPSLLFPILSGIVVAAFNYEPKKTSRVFTKRTGAVIGNTVTVPSTQTDTVKMD